MTEGDTLPRKAMDLDRRVRKGTYPVPDFPEYPARVLLAHCVMKGVQWSVLGLGLWPVLAATRGTSFKRVFLSLPAAGTTATLLMLSYKTAYSMDADGVDDRAYRIAKSASQNAVDRSSITGAAVGATVGAVLVGGGIGYVAAMASFGCACGVALHCAEGALAEAEKAGYIAMR